MDDIVAGVRSFNRAWSDVLGLLDRGLLDTPYTLPEARVIFELAQRDAWERGELRAVMAIDDSFLTRILGALQRRGLVTSQPSPLDGRRRRVMLTPAGREAFVLLDERSTAQIERLVGAADPRQRRQLLAAMTTISTTIGNRTNPVVTLREPEPGDLGWVIGCHGEVYWDEFGWDRSFEGLVARIVADFEANLRPERERAWIAALDTVRAGCVFCCQRDAATAQLRILLVEPWARGHGVGRRLVDACIEFATAAGYRSMVLWTNDVLVSARRIYEVAGFRLVDEEPHHSFGHDLVGQNWVRDL